MSVSFDSYKTFYYVARLGSFTEAAKALYVTQPTVTHAIQMLEQELDCVLFQRSRKGVSLPPEAAMLYEHVRAACEHIFEAESALKAKKKLLEGQVRIGASETTLHFFLLPFLKEFKTLHPGVKIKVSNSSTPTALAALRSGHIDFAILVMRPGYKGAILPQDKFSVTRLAGFQDIFIAGNDFSDLAGRSVTPGELCGYPFICMEPGTVTRQFLDDFLLQFHLAVSPDIELATTDLITPMAANNLGVGFVPRAFARSALEEGSVFQIRLTEIVPEREICVISRTDTPLSLAGNAFLRLFSDFAEPSCIKKDCR